MDISEIINNLKAIGLYYGTKRSEKDGSYEMLTKSDVQTINQAINIIEEFNGLRLLDDGTLIVDYPEYYDVHRVFVQYDKAGHFFYEDGEFE